MKNSICAICLLAILIVGCGKNEPPVNPDIKYGKNKFSTVVDGIEREYFVSVPKNYDGKTAVPVVFMLHGTGGDGEKFYNISGWKEVGDQENILTVFPSALSRCIIEEGEAKTISKWNSLPAANFYYCAKVTPPDDVKFFKTIIDEITEKYKIDSKRIYFVGFSNGGQMCAKLSMEMGDKIAAIVESAAAFRMDTTFVPVRKMPVTFQLGNGDYGPGKEGPFIPLSNLSSMLSFPGPQPYATTQTYIKSFDLNPNYTISGDTDTVVIATYLPNEVNANYEYNFALIKDLAHLYPNGANHLLYGARINWAWLKNYTLP